MISRKVDFITVFSEVCFKLMTEITSFATGSRFPCNRSNTAANLDTNRWETVAKVSTKRHGNVALIPVASRPLEAECNFN